jgi:hypothetical protein
MIAGLRRGAKKTLETAVDMTMVVPAFEVMCNHWSAQKEGSNACFHKVGEAQENIKASIDSL